MALSAKRPSKGEQTRKRIMQDITDLTEKRRRLNAEVPESLYRAIKLKAAEEDRSISEITRDLWAEYLSKTPIE